MKKWRGGDARQLRGGEVRPQDIIAAAEMLCLIHCYCTLKILQDQVNDTRSQAGRCCSRTGKRAVSSTTSQKPPTGYTTIIASLRFAHGKKVDTCIIYARVLAGSHGSYINSAFRQQQSSSILLVQVHCDTTPAGHVRTAILLLSSWSTPSAPVSTLQPCRLGRRGRGFLIPMSARAAVGTAKNAVHLLAGKSEHFKPLV